MKYCHKTPYTTEGVMFDSILESDIFLCHAIHIGIHCFKHMFTFILKCFQAQEDERSLYQSDWSGDQSMDHTSYGSIFLQIKEANADSESTCDYLTRTIDIIDGSRE